MGAAMPNRGEVRDSKHACGGEPPSKRRKTTKQVYSDSAYQRRAPRAAKKGVVRMLIVTLDYKHTGNRLNCKVDGKNMEKLAHACGVKDITILLEPHCSKDNVRSKIKEVASRCGPDDYFVFYYSGHGAREHKHDDLCLRKTDGKIEFFEDDELAPVVASSVGPGVRVIFLPDCCHSGTIADLGEACWKNIEAISISGCLDREVSYGDDDGGYFTNSMLMAIERLQRANIDQYSVGFLYNATVKMNHGIFGYDQTITIHTSRASGTNKMAWPFIPLRKYKSPIGDAMHLMRVSIPKEISLFEQTDRALYQSTLEKCGVSSSIAKLAVGDVEIFEVNVDDLMLKQA